MEAESLDVVSSQREEWQEHDARRPVHTNVESVDLRKIRPWNERYEIKGLRISYTRGRRVRLKGVDDISCYDTLKHRLR